MINFWRYFHYKNNINIKIITPLIKYITLMFFLLGFIVSYGNKQRFKEADDTGVTAEGKKIIISANNKFAFNLYSYLNTESPNENIFFSPYGVFTAMAITYEGAHGKTAKEMQSFFHFPTDNKVRRPAIANIYNLLNAPKEGYQLFTANALWIHKNLESKIFKEIQKYYGAEIFIKTSAKKVNQWIESKTMNKFKNAVKECKELCALDVINTIYFKGDWKRKFKKAKTKKSSFIINEKEEVKVPMMNVTADFNYMETETMQMLEMPYKGDTLSMLVLLPKSFPGKADLLSLEKALTEENLKEWKNALLPGEITVYMPKFTFKKDYELSKSLKQYMPLAFNPGKADFLKFSENIELYISNITHKSFIDVNEEGTEASAVTVARIRFVSLPPEFKANHPFIFLIQERETGQILFIGKLVNPIK